MPLLPKPFLTLVLLLGLSSLQAQVPVNLRDYQPGSGTKVTRAQQDLTLQWPAGKGVRGRLVLDLDPQRPLLRSIGIGRDNGVQEVARNLDPVFLLTVGSAT